MNSTNPSNQPQPGAVLWDLDGTLIDTAVIHWRAWNEELLPRGRELSWEEFSSSFGQRNDMVLRRWIRSDISISEIAEIGHSKEIRYRRLVRDEGIDLLPGVLPCLEDLHSAGWKQALATMSGKDNVAAIFNVLQIQPYFDAVVHGDEVTHGKPDPEVFIKAAEKLGVSARCCIVVEDSAAGIEGAKKAGMHTIGVNQNTYLPAELYIPTLTHLPIGAFTTLLEAK